MISTRAFLCLALLASTAGSGGGALSGGNTSAVFGFNGKKR